MSSAPALLAFALVAYAQSGMPGLGAFELLFSLLKRRAAFSEDTTDGPGEEVAVAEPNNEENNKDFKSPISVRNDNVEEASVNIEINYYHHHYYYDKRSDDQPTISDGGSWDEEDK